MTAHRAPGRALTRLPSLDFVAYHCAGTSCFHTHADEEPLPVFAGLDVPVLCGREFSHPKHPHQGGQCPGLRDAAALPKERVSQHAATARAAMKENPK